MSDVFISYSRRNKDFARRLFDALQAVGRDTWADWEDIPYSVDWWKEICFGIDAANVFIFVISPDSLTSMVCNQEVHYARQNNKRIIPVMYTDIDEKQIAGEWFNKDWEATARENWNHLKTLNWLFFREQDDFETAFQSLIQTAEHDPEHIRYHTRLLVRAREWASSTQRDNSLLLRGNDLREAENWAKFNQSRQPQPTDLHLEYIQAAVVQRQQEELEEQKRRQRLRTLVVVLSILLIIALLAIGVAVNRSQAANREANERATQQLLAENNAATATNALGREAVALSTSEQRGTEAANQRNTAVAAQATSEQNTRESQSLALAASAVQVLDAGNGDLALALALAATNIENPPSRAQDALTAAAFTSGTVSILAGHEHHVLDVAFSPDGQFAASAGRDGRVIVWVLQSGEQLFVIDLSQQTDIDTVQSVQFSPDGHQLLTGSSFQEVVLWDAATGTLIRKFEGHGNNVQDAVFNTDGRRILSASENGIILLWDVNSGEIIQRLDAHTDNLNRVALSPDERYAAAATDEALLLWELGTGEEVWRYVDPEGTIETVVFTHDGRYLLADHNDYELMLWDVDTREEIRRYTQPELDGLIDATVSTNDMMIAAGTFQGDILLWDFTSGALIHRHVGHNDLVSEVAFSLDEHSLLSSSHDSFVRLWRVDSALEIRRFTGHTEVITGVVLSEDEQIAYTASRDHTIIQWNMGTGTIIRTLNGHTAPVQGLALHPDGQILLSGDESGTIIAWDVSTGTEIQRYEESDGHGITHIDFDPEGRYAVFSLYLFGEVGSDGYMLWDVNSWETVRKYIEADTRKSAIYTVFSPDGHQLVTTGYHVANIIDASPEGYIQFSDVQNGETLGFITAHSDTIWKITFSPDARYFATVSLDNTAILWDAETNEAIRTFVGHTAEAVDVVFSPDARHVATAGRDGYVILWDIETGAPLLALMSDRYGVNEILYSHDGRYLISGGGDAILREWLAPPTLRELINWVYEHRYVRELTCDERRVYEVEPFCDTSGTYSTNTPYPTLSPTATFTASPTVDLTLVTATLSTPPVPETPSHTPSATLSASPTQAAVSEDQIRRATSALNFTVLIPDELPGLSLTLIESDAVVNYQEDFGFIMGQSDSQEGQVLFMSYEGGNNELLIIQLQSPFANVQEWLDHTEFASMFGMVGTEMEVDSIELIGVNLSRIGQSGGIFGMIYNETLIVMATFGRDSLEGNVIAAALLDGTIIEPQPTAIPTGP